MLRLIDTPNTTRAYPTADWYDAVRARVSRRKYDGSAVSATHLGILSSAADASRTAETRAVIVGDAPEAVFTEVLDGRIGGYGRVTGVRSCVVLIGREGSDVEAGYLGEAIVLEATRLHIDSCWIGGSFDSGLASGLVELEVGESVLAVIALGRAMDRPTFQERGVWMMMGSRRRRSVEDIAPGIDATWPEWARSAVGTARLAPSGGNQQPWLFSIDGDGALVIRPRENARYPSTMMDCGIAMLHAEVGSVNAGVRGHWERLASPAIARFLPSGV